MFAGNMAPPIADPPAWFKILVALLIPPVAACIFWVQVRGEALLIWRGKPSQRTKNREKKEFWLLLAFGYVVAIAGIAFALAKGTL